LPESYVVSVRILDAELTEAVWGVVDRVVDSGASVLDLGVDGIDIVHADVGVPHLVDDLPVRDEPWQSNPSRSL
jgi:hypothetical protein